MSYSGRKSSATLRLVFFFICVLFGSGELSCADDSNSHAAIGVCDEQETGLVGQAYCYATVLVCGVIRIVSGSAQGIPEDR